MTTCPECQGVGRRSGYRFVNRGAAGCTGEAFNEPCEMCDGVGQLDLVHVAHVALAQEFHDWRIQHKRSLRDLGVAWGYSPAVISKAEHLGIGPGDVFDRMRQALAPAAGPGAREEG